MHKFSCSSVDLVFLSGDHGCLELRVKSPETRRLESYARCGNAMAYGRSVQCACLTLAAVGLRTMAHRELGCLPCPGLGGCNSSCFCQFAPHLFV